jgi:hypothetical protein
MNRCAVRILLPGRASSSKEERKLRMCYVYDPSGRNSLEAQQRAILERPISQSFETITLSVALTNNQELIFTLPSGEKVTVFHWDVERLVRMLVPYIEQIDYPR